ncbi:MAG: FG-GAP-like repeat-containing protein [Ignavibacteria bacterium]|nr:FG-GAP-like repeat-containing protein [Ignavibacteria bacterium]
MKTLYKFKHKGIKFTYLFAILFLLSFLMYSFITNDKKINYISYIESSSGLQTITLESGRTELEFADLNNDGFLDIISIGDHGNPLINSQQQGVMVWFGNGTGANWNHFQTGYLGYGGIAVGDVNNDGKQDIGYGMHHNYSTNDFGDQILEVALGNGTGTNWIPYDDSLAMNGETWGMFTSDFGDVDNDGLLDLGSISFGCCNGIRVYKNLGTGVWRQTFASSGGNSNMEFSFGDINKDGNLDLAGAHQYATVYFGNGNGGFTPAQYNLPAPPSSGHQGVSLGDVDNDGAMDVSFIGSGGSVNVWKFDRVALQYVNLSANLPSSGSYSASVLYDMDSDNFCDLILYGSATLTVWKGNGGTNWTQVASFSVPSPGNYSAIAVADADRNGYADIALQTAHQVSLFNYRNMLRFFKETTPYSSLSIKPIFPKGYEYFKPGCVRFIKWISSAPSSQDSRVKLELSTTGPSGPFVLIADSVKNNGIYQWSIPTGIASNNCFIKYTVYIVNTTQTYTAMNTNPFGIGVTTDEKITKYTIPQNFLLEQNYPNPFNNSTIIKYQLPQKAFVSLKVFDISGKEIATLVNEIKNAGFHEITFNTYDIPSGVYFYKIYIYNLNRGEIFYSNVKKLVLVK